MLVMKVETFKQERKQKINKAIHQAFPLKTGSITFLANKFDHSFKGNLVSSLQDEKYDDGETDIIGQKKKIQNINIGPNI